MHIYQLTEIRLLRWVAFLCLILSFQQCKKTEPDKSVDRITLAVNVESILADGQTTASFTMTAYNAAGTALREAELTLYVNGQVISSNKFSTAEAGEYNFIAKSGSVSSNEVKLLAYHDTRIAGLQLSANTDTIVANGDSTVTFEVLALNAAGDPLDTTGYYTIYANGTALKGSNFSTTEPGNYSFEAKTEAGITSNAVTVEAKKPLVLSKIALTSNTYLIIADGESAATINLKLFDEKNQEVTTSEYQLYANGTAIEGTAFHTNQPGEYAITATGGGTTSDAIIINARPDVQYDIVTIPIIFHLGHFGEAVGETSNLTQAQVAKMIENANMVFANGLNSTNPNAVDMRIRVRLAQYDPQGNKLAEPGISRENVTSYDDGVSPDTYDTANDRQLGGNEKNRWEKDHYWDPKAYLNVWIFRQENRESSAALPFLNEGYSLEGLETLTSDCEFCETSTFYVPGVSMHFADASRNVTLAHEVAHVLGLLHPFSLDNCVTSDHCFDTYTWNYYNKNLDCVDSNKGLLAHDNIMDYEGVPTTFTYDQRERVQYVLKYGFRISDLKNSKK